MRGLETRITQIRNAECADWGRGVRGLETRIEDADLWLLTKISGGKKPREHFQCSYRGYRLSSPLEGEDKGGGDDPRSL